MLARGVTQYTPLLQTTQRSTTWETPFMLTYDWEAIVPVEIGAGSFRREHFDLQVNEVNHKLYLNKIEETRANS